MTDDMNRVAANVDRFSGFADVYDRFRPHPPTAIVDLLTQLSCAARPRVVDLGSGTGLSTLLWNGRAQSVIGIEPNPDMRAQASRRAADSGAVGISFIDGLSTATGLPDGCADIVTCSQSLHWMEPEGTFAEVARILRPRGIFAAYDCDWPPTLNPDAEQAYDACRMQASAVEQSRRLSPHVHKWNKREHLDRMRKSGHFRYAREVLIHHIESGDADRLVGVMLSQGEVATLLRNGISEEEIGITALRKAVREAIGDRTVPWYWSYRVRLAVR